MTPSVWFGNVTVFLQHSNCVIISVKIIYFSVYQPHLYVFTTIGVRYIKLNICYPQSSAIFENIMNFKSLYISTCLNLWKHHYNAKQYTKISMNSVYTHKLYFLFPLKYNLVTHLLHPFIHMLYLTIKNSISSNLDTLLIRISHYAPPLLITILM